MIKKCYSHTFDSISDRNKTQIDTTEFNSSNQLFLLSKMADKLERTPRTTPDTKDPTTCLKLATIFFIIAAFLPG